MESKDLLKQKAMNKDQILNIISKHTVGVGRAKTLEALADLENNTVDELYALFSIHSVIVPKGTLCDGCNGTGYDKRKQCMDCKGSGNM